MVEGDTFLGVLINTAALARRKDALWRGELFHQFVSRHEKPLKQLVGGSSGLHRAKATVLMRVGWLAMIYAG